MCSFSPKYSRIFVQGSGGGFEKAYLKEKYFVLIFFYYYAASVVILID